MMTFREKTTHLLKRLRRIQMVSLILLLVGFVLPFFGWESNVMLYGKILMLIGFMGEFYCWAKARQAHRLHGRILLLGEGQTDQMPPMREKPWISAS